MDGGLRMPEQTLLLVIVTIAWLVMYVMVLGACAMVYKAAKSRGSGAGEWLIASLLPGVVGLAIMLIPLAFPQAPSAPLCVMFGVLLSAMGPLLYLLVEGRE
ncbi:hypothetical protein DRO60_04500 [Candidatus Bathyarchaeota archaeon]|nr:MAG: hypothetical protein DRO60_04500 [Candidatus Bathyarchaeota archaeon]